MASKKTPPRLGRGLAVLLGDTAMPPNIERGNSVDAIPMDQIDANPFQPRTDFDPAELESFAESIRVQGLLQPILIVRIQQRRIGSRSSPGSVASGPRCRPD